MGKEVEGAWNGFQEKVMFEFLPPYSFPIPHPYLLPLDLFSPCWVIQPQPLLLLLPLTQMIPKEVLPAQSTSLMKL